MIIGSNQSIEVQLWKRVDGKLIPAEQVDVCRPDYQPILVIKPNYIRLTPSSGIPLVYEDNALFMFYQDALTAEYITEQIELIDNQHTKIISDAEQIMRDYFADSK